MPGEAELRSEDDPSSDDTCPPCVVLSALPALRCLTLLLFGVGAVTTITLNRRKLTFKGWMISPSSVVLIIFMLLSPNFVSPTLMSPLNSALTCYCIGGISSQMAHGCIKSNLSENHAPGGHLLLPPTLLLPQASPAQSNDSSILPGP